MSIRFETCQIATATLHKLCVFVTISRFNTIYVPKWYPYSAAQSSTGTVTFTDSGCGRVTEQSRNTVFTHCWKDKLRRAAVYLFILFLSPEWHFMVTTPNHTQNQPLWNHQKLQPSAWPFALPTTNKSTTKRNMRYYVVCMLMLAMPW